MYARSMPRSDSNFVLGLVSLELRSRIGRLCHRIHLKPRNSPTLDHLLLHFQLLRPLHKTGTVPTTLPFTRSNSFTAASLYCLVSKMNLLMRLLGGFVLLVFVPLIPADTNFSAISVQSSNMNTSPFRGFDDRPDDCPPWYSPLLPIP